MTRNTWILVGAVVAVIAVITLIYAVKLSVRVVALKRQLGELGMGGKFVFWGALIYTIFPIDILPDPIYLDDITVLGGALFFLTRLLRKQETLRGGLPHVQRVARQVTQRRAGKSPSRDA